MTTGVAHITVEQFDHMIAQPDYAERLVEYIGGEVVEVVLNPRSSAIAGLILAEIVFFLKDKGWGYVTGADGGYAVAGERYIPDMAYISKARQPQLVAEGYNPNPPELAVEVLSPSNDPHLMRIKTANFLAASTTVWIVNPVARTVEVYAPGQPVKRLGTDDTLDGGDVLPGLRIAIAGIFPEESPSDIPAAHES